MARAGRGLVLARGLAVACWSSAASVVKSRLGAETDGVGCAAAAWPQRADLVPRAFVSRDPSPASRVRDAAPAVSG